MNSTEFIWSEVPTSAERKHEGPLLALRTWTQLFEVRFNASTRVSPVTKKKTRRKTHRKIPTSLKKMREKLEAAEHARLRCVCVCVYEHVLLPPSRCSRCLSAKTLCSPCGARLTACGVLKKGGDREGTHRDKVTPGQSWSKCRKPDF